MRLGNPNLAIDTQLESEGKWIDCPSLWWRDKETPMRVLLRGASSRQHQALIRSKTKDLTREQIEERSLDLSADLAVELVAGWENWFDPEGNAVSFTVETCRNILHDQDNRRLLDFINRVAGDLTTFNAERREEVEKNSQDISNGA